MGKLLDLLEAADGLSAGDRGIAKIEKKAKKAPLNSLTSLSSHSAPDELETDQGRECHARLVAIDRQRRAGEVPKHYTATTTCRSCGDVPIFEGAPAHVDGCPWCLIGGAPRRGES